MKHRNEKTIKTHAPHKLNKQTRIQKKTNPTTKVVKTQGLSLFI